MTRERRRRAEQGDSSGTNSRGLPHSCREVRWDRERRSMTGMASLLLSSDTSLSSLQVRSSTAASHTPACTCLQGKQLGMREGMAARLGCISHFKH